MKGPTAALSSSDPKLTRASQVLRALREAILDGSFPPGSKVNLEEARERFGVSLSPMREAISRLVAEGLVEFEDQRGYRIAPVSAAGLDEATRLTADLAALALGHAVVAGDLDWESAVLAAGHRLSRANGDAAAWDSAYPAFVSALVSGCGLPTLIRFLDMLSFQTERYRRMARRAGLAFDPAAAEACRAVADAAVARDGELATTLLKRQIEAAGARVAATLAPRFAEAGP